jgi:alpha-glucosidase
MQMVRATYEGLKKLFHKKRPFTITRAAYSGTQRYGAVWTGDNVATWEHLRLGALQMQRLSVSGMSFCGTDIGGFSGNPDGELFTRWLQLGVFSPFMRAHSAGDTGEREPWSFGEYYENINRKFIELRYKLLPYIYSAFWEQSRYGYPILRPVLMLEQESGNINREEEFAFGDKILVAPILRQGVSAKRVYLPKGKWYDFWDHAPFEGGQEYEVETNIETMPIFIKEGAVMPEAPVMQYSSEKAIEIMHLKVYHTDKKVNSFLYEDHGDTYAYESDVYAEKKFTVSGDQTKLTITQQVDGLFKESYSDYVMVLYGLPFEAKSVRVDGVISNLSTHTDGFPKLVVSKEFKNIIVES